ncbi:unnamed protein product [Candida verbasci]|uniref:BHLH domain-containing protein n=1 Tax=Candida verbasci TaxID=1227364 RepID=A0A9W4TVL1_9ASCO|nr:unnamed protein product [Candida verbasci]
MESHVWNNTFSPDNQNHHHLDHSQSGNTPNNNDVNSNASTPNTDHHHHTQQQQQPQHSHLNITSHHLNSTNFTDSEQLFLQQIEQNLYEHQQHQHHHNDQHSVHHPHNSSTGNTPDLQFHADSNDHQHHILGHHQHQSSQHSNNNSTGNTPSNSASLTAPPQSYEFGLENINFIIPEDLNFDADPNHVSSAFPPNLPSNHQTPSLLAANKKQDHLSHVHEDFTNSPILPGQNEKSYNNQHYYHRQNSSGKIYTSRDVQQQQQQHVRPDAVFTPLVSPAVTPLDKAASSSFQQGPVNVSFEPLTSPALNAQNSTTSNDRRRSASSVYAPQDSNQSNNSKSYKRRTPHGTPVLQANSSSKNYKSPNIKPRNNGYSFEKLPESSISDDKDSKSSTNSNDMLPPSGKPLEINDPPLMGFTMGKLAEEENQNQNQSQNQKKLTKPKVARKSSYSKSRSTSSSENSSPVLNKKPEKPATKKASHKLAEQGRRNRMNMAVHELGVLIPQSYHEEVSIPSKATTVELASKYIKALLKEIDQLKNSK